MKVNYNMTINLPEGVDIYGSEQDTFLSYPRDPVVIAVMLVEFGEIVAELEQQYVHAC